MANQQMSLDDAYAIISRMNETFQAAVTAGNAGAPFDLQPITIDLSTARLETSPLIVSFPFKTVYVQDASDSSARVSLRYGTQDTYQGSINLQYKDALKLEKPATKAFLWWNAQVGKSVTLVFMVTSSIDSGSKSSQVSSSVDGNSINDFAPVSVTTTAANLIDNTARNIINLYNEGPDDCYIGGAGVSAVAGSERGILLKAFQERQYKNTAAVYAASIGSSNIRFQTES